MDEPLTNLDAELRADMRTEIKHLQAELGTTMVYVTHDQVEAMSLGHRIAILNKGRVEQIGTPLEVYDRPASLFCAAFIGSPPMNLIEVEVADGALRGPGGLVLTPPPGLPRDRRLVAGVRPEALEVTDTGGGTVGPGPRRLGGVRWATRSSTWSTTAGSATSGSGCHRPPVSPRTHRSGCATPAGPRRSTT